MSPGSAAPSTPSRRRLAITSDGAKLVVANFENDSISIVDVASSAKTAELDLRPGKIDPTMAGVPGGEFPYWVTIKGKRTAYVSSIRDREIIVVDIAGTPSVRARIQVQGNPNKMLLTKSGHRLLVASGQRGPHLRHRHAQQSDRRRHQQMSAHRAICSRLTACPWAATPTSLALSPEARGPSTSPTARQQLGGGGD